MKTEQEGVTREGDREARGQEIGNRCWRAFWELAPAQISPDCTINVWLFSHAFGGNLHCSSPWWPLPTDLQWPAHQRYWQQLNCPSRGLKNKALVGTPRGWEDEPDTSEAILENLPKQGIHTHCMCPGLSSTVVQGLSQGITREHRAWLLLPWKVLRWELCQHDTALEQAAMNAKSQF